jgi:hypothetical protein
MVVALLVHFLTRGSLNAGERRFPTSWSAEVTPNCFIVREANGQ